MLNQANWKLFKELTIIQEDVYDMTNDINSLVSKFNEFVKQAPDTTILKTTGREYNPISWWNEEFIRSQKQRNNWIRRYRRTNTVQDKIKLNKATPIARRAKRQARKLTWQKYATSINVRHQWERSGRK